MGGEVRVWADWQDGVNSAESGAWYQPDGNRHSLFLGRQGNQPMSTLEVVGHEFAHGLIRSTAGLAYERESGALHESLADIFGVLVSQHTLGGPVDWEIGRRIGTLRSLQSPTDYGQPASYGEAPFWVAPDATACATPQPEAFPVGNDNCGIHTNSSIGGRWFYLLVEEAKTRKRRSTAWALLPVPRWSFMP